MPVTLDVARTNIQSGEAFKPPPAVSETSQAAELLGSAGEAVSALGSSVTAGWQSMTKNLSSTLSITSSQVEVIELEAKSQGREATEEELDEACGPLSFLTKIPDLLGDALKDIFGKIDEFATSFGRAIGEFADELTELVTAVTDAIDEATAAIAQAALDAFKLVNDAAVKALEAVDSVVSTVTSAIGDAFTFATDSLNSAIDKLSAFADSLNLASLFKLDCQTDALEKAVDQDKIADQAEVQRVMASTPANGTDTTITSPTLSEPQTTFAPAPSTAPPPNLQSLITQYQIAARAFKASVDEVAQAISQGKRANVTRAQQEDLRSNRDSLLNELRQAALAEGVNIDTLPIHGDNFDTKLILKEIRRGTDQYGDEIVTYGTSYDESQSPSIQKEIAAIKADIAIYNRLNKEQFSEKQSQKYSFANINVFSTPNQETRNAWGRTDAKTRDVRALRSSIVLQIANADPAVKKAVGPIDDVFT